MTDPSLSFGYHPTPIPSKLVAMADHPKQKETAVALRGNLHFA